MSDSRNRPETPSTRDGQRSVLMQDILKTATSNAHETVDQADAGASDVDVLNFLQAFNGELESALSMSSSNPFNDRTKKNQTHI